MPNNYGGSYLGAGENNHIYFCGAHSNGGNIGGFPLVGNGLWVGKLGPAEAVSTASVAEKQFTISPNPASGWLDIRFGENGFSEGNIAVYNALGAAVLRQSVTSKNIRLDVSGWQEGSYFLQYLGEGVSVSSRVVVER